MVLKNIWSHDWNDPTDENEFQRAEGKSGRLIGGRIILRVGPRDLSAPWTRSPRDTVEGEGEEKKGEDPENTRVDETSASQSIAEVGPNLPVSSEFDETLLLSEGFLLLRRTRATPSPHRAEDGRRIARPTRCLCQRSSQRARISAVARGQIGSATFAHHCSAQ